MSFPEVIQIPKILYETESPLNGKITVVHVGRTKKIMVDNIVQSLNWDSPACARLYWGKTIEVLKEEIPDVRKMLLLGLGGGTLVHLLSKNFPNLDLVSVEFDPVMVDVATKFFDLDAVPNHRVILGDALKVVIDPQEYGIQPGSLDCLMVDIYVGENYPDLGKCGNFVAGVKSLVRSGGLIIFNRIYLDRHQDDVNSFINYLHGLLTDVRCLVVAGYTNSDNVLIYGRA